MNEPFEKTRLQRALEIIVIVLMFTLSFGICTRHGRAADDGYLDEGEDSINYHKFEYEEDLSWWSKEELEIPSDNDLIMLSAALEACPNGYRGSHDALITLIRLERELGVHDWIPGALIGVFCVESSYRIRTRRGGKILGDYRGKVAMAHGPFQMWPVNRRYCGEKKGESHDLEWSARCWVKLVERTHKKAKGKCPGSAWRTAEAAVSNIAKYQWSCDLSSKHWKVAERINAIYQRRVQGAL